MNASPALSLNAVLGGMVATGGLWMLMGELSLPVTVVIVVALTVGLLKVSPTVAHIWLWTTVILGIESLVWPVQTMSKLQGLGPEPPLEVMQQMFTAVLFGVFSGIFWLTFAYGIYRRIHPLPQTTDSPSTSFSSKSRRKKKR